MLKGGGGRAHVPARAPAAGSSRGASVTRVRAQALGTLVPGARRAGLSAAEGAERRLQQLSGWCLEGRSSLLRLRSAAAVEEDCSCFSSYTVAMRGG